MVYDSLEGAVGGTPVIRLNALEKQLGLKSELYVKLESFNPYSVKDRAAKRILDDAEADGRLKKGGVIVEPTSGNTGIGLAFLAAVRGYKLYLTMPESMSEERRQVLKALGASLVLTPAEKGMKGAIERAKELAAQLDGFMPDQFSNPSNARAHVVTAREIAADMGKRGLDFFVSAVGTGGTLTGCGGELKRKYKALQIVAVEPEESQVLSGKAAGPHKIQGIGAGFVPALLDTSLIGAVVPVSGKKAFEFAALVAKTEGILCGISSGAALCAAVTLAAENEGKRVLTIFPDDGFKYLSVKL